MLTPEDEIIRYDGRTFAIATCPLVEIEAHRGRRWGWFGRKGWWVHLRLFHDWHLRKFVYRLSESGIFLKPDSDALPGINENRKRLLSPGLVLKPSQSSAPWSNKMPFLLL